MWLMAIVFAVVLDLIFAETINVLVRAFVVRIVMKVRNQFSKLPGLDVSQSRQHTLLRTYHAEDSIIFVAFF